MYIIFSFLFLFKIKYLYSYIVLQIDTLSIDNYKSIYEPNSPKDKISKDFISTFFTELEIGTPIQKIPMLIKMKINDYVITSSYKLENPSQNFTKLTYNFSKNFLNKYSFYNEKNSITFNSSVCRKRGIIDEDDNDLIAEEMCPSNETIILYDNINIQNNKKLVVDNLYFDLVRNIRDNVTGVIGLGIKDRFSRMSFLKVLKDNNLIKNYYWFFDFDTWDNQKGKIIIGSLPHEIYKDKYSEEDLFFSKTCMAGYAYWEMFFDKIYINNNSDSNNGKIYFNNERVEFNFEYNAFVGAFDYRDYMKSLLKDLLLEKKCFNDSFYGYEDFYDYDYQYTFYYCRNEKDIKNKLNELISPIFFYSNEFNYVFEITKNDILKEKGNYIFIHILFIQYLNKWILGKSIALRYKFIFNQEIKRIGFYSKLKDSNINTNAKSSIFIQIISVILFIIAIGLGFVLTRKICKLHKRKRINELNDDYKFYSLEMRDNENLF